MQHDPLRRIRDSRCAPEDVQREKARQLESWDRWVAEQVMRTFKRSAGAKRDPPLRGAKVLSGSPHYEARRYYVGLAVRWTGAEWNCHRGSETEWPSRPLLRHVLHGLGVRLGSSGVRSWSFRTALAAASRRMRTKRADGSPAGAHAALRCNGCAACVTATGLQAGAHTVAIG